MRNGIYAKEWRCEIRARSDGHGPPQGSASPNGSNGGGVCALRRAFVAATALLLLLLAYAATAGSLVALAADRPADRHHERRVAGRVATFSPGRSGTSASVVAHRAQPDRPPEPAPGEHDIDLVGGGSFPPQYSPPPHFAEAPSLPLERWSSNGEAGAAPLLDSHPAAAVPEGSCRTRAPPRR